MWYKATMFIAGFALTICGVMLILQQWGAVVMLFKGIIGMLLAVAGLVILFASTLKNP